MKVEAGKVTKTVDLIEWERTKGDRLSYLERPLLAERASSLVSA